MARKIKQVGRNRQRDSSAEVSSKDLLIEAFLVLAHRHGASQVTMQMIADQAGVAFGTVAYYFPRKNSKIEAEALSLLMSKANTFLTEAIFQDRSQVYFNPILSYVNHMLHWLKLYPHHASFLIYYYYLSTTEGETFVSNSVFLERAYSRIEGLINESIGMGIYQPIDNKKDLVKKLYAIIMGASITIATAKNWQTLDVQVEFYKVHVHELIILIQQKKN